MSETGEYHTGGTDDPTETRSAAAPHTPDTNVAPPRFPETGSAPFSPGNSESPGYSADAPGDPPAPSGAHAPGPPTPPASLTADPTATPGRWPTFTAPAVAAVVLLAGMAFLMLRVVGDDTSAGNDTNRRDTEDTLEESDPVETDLTDDPDSTADATTTVASTIPVGTPRPTPPPLVEPPIVTTETQPEISAPTPTTAAPTTVTPTTTPEGGPTRENVQDALLLRSDLSDPSWFASTPPAPASLCGDNPDEDNFVHREQVFFERVSDDPVALRQISHTIYSFADEATANRAFEADVELLNECAVSSIDIDGTTYELEVEVSQFSEEDAEPFPCSDDNVIIITQLNNSDALVPFIGEATASFRCGRNVSIVSFVSTLELDDLQQDDYFSAVAATNPRAGELPGS